MDKVNFAGFVEFSLMKRDLVPFKDTDNGSFPYFAWKLSKIKQLKFEKS